MARLSQFLSSQELYKLKSLEFVPRSVVEGSRTGTHKSHLKGFSLEFAEHRQYVPGDDLRHLDWTVYAKTNRFYIKEYEAETNLRAVILLDTSGSMAYGSKKVTKLEYGKVAAAALSYLLITQQDYVGLLTFSSDINNYIPPRGGVRHLDMILNELEKRSSRGEAHFSQVFNKIVAKIKKRGLIVVLSDCLTDPELLLRAMVHFRHEKHEVLLIHILDRAEVEFPFNSFTQFECLERSNFKLQLDARQIKKSYLENLNRFLNEIKHGCHQHRIEYLFQITDTPFVDTFAKYLLVMSKLSRR